MASNSNLSPSNQTPKPSDEHVAISEHEETPQEEVPVNVCVTDSDSGSDSSLHGSNSGFKLHSAPVIPPAKRPGGSGKGNSSKKRKRSKKSSNVGSGTHSRRKWELEDEIVVLKEMCEIKTLDGKLDEISLFDCLKGKLKGEYSIDQLKNKMRNMRTKYGVWVKDGDFADLDSHEAVVFGLSEKVWGDVVMRTNRVHETDVNENVVGEGNDASVGDGVRKAVVNENGVGEKKSGEKNAMSVGNGVGEKESGVKNVKSVGKGDRESGETKNGVGGKKIGRKNVKRARETVVTENVDAGTEDGVNEKEEIGEGNFVRDYKRLCESTVKLMKKNLNLIGKANGNELDDEWKMLWMEEMELNHKKAVVRMKQIELVYDHIKNS